MGTISNDMRCGVAEFNENLYFREDVEDMIKELDECNRNRHTDRIPTLKRNLKTMFDSVGIELDCNNDKDWEVVELKKLLEDSNFPEISNFQDILCDVMTELQKSYVSPSKYMERIVNNLVDSKYDGDNIPVRVKILRQCLGKLDYLRNTVFYQKKIEDTIRTDYGGDIAKIDDNIFQRYLNIKKPHKELKVLFDAYGDMLFGDKEHDNKLEELVEKYDEGLSGKTISELIGILTDPDSVVDLDLVIKVRDYIENKRSSYIDSYNKEIHELAVKADSISGYMEEFIENNDLSEYFYGCEKVEDYIKKKEGVIKGITAEDKKYKNFFKKNSKKEKEMFALLCRDTVKFIKEKNLYYCFKSDELSLWESITGKRIEEYDVGNQLIVNADNVENCIEFIEIAVCRIGDEIYNDSDGTTFSEYIDQTMCSHIKSMCDDAVGCISVKTIQEHFKKLLVDEYVSKKSVQVGKTKEGKPTYGYKYSIKSTLTADEYKSYIEAVKERIGNRLDALSKEAEKFEGFPGEEALKKFKEDRDRNLLEELKAFAEKKNVKHLLLSQIIAVAAKRETDAAKLNSSIDFFCKCDGLTFIKKTGFANKVKDCLGVKINVKAENFSVELKKLTDKKFIKDGSPVIDFLMKNAKKQSQCGRFEVVRGYEELNRAYCEADEKNTEKEYFIIDSIIGELNVSDSIKDELREKVGKCKDERENNAGLTELLPDEISKFLINRIFDKTENFSEITAGIIVDAMIRLGKEINDEYNKKINNAKDNSTVPLILKIADDLAEGKFKDGLTMKSRLYMFAFAFNMNVNFSEPYARHDAGESDCKVAKTRRSRKKEIESLRNIKKSLFEDYYSENIIRFVDHYEKSGTKYEEPTGIAIQYKNYAEIIYLYWLNRNDENLTPAEKYAKANEMIKDIRTEIEGYSPEKTANRNAFIDGLFTQDYRNYVRNDIYNEVAETDVKNILSMDEDKFKNVLEGRYKVDSGVDAHNFLGNQSVQTTASEIFCELIDEISGSFPNHGIGAAVKRVCGLDFFINGKAGGDDVNKRKLKSLENKLNNLMKYFFNEETLNAYRYAYNNETCVTYTRTRLIFLYYIYCINTGFEDSEGLYFGEDFNSFRKCYCTKLNEYLEACSYQLFSEKNLIDVMLLYSAFMKFKGIVNDDSCEESDESKESKESAESAESKESKESKE